MIFDYFNENIWFGSSNELQVTSDVLINALHESLNLEDDLKQIALFKSYMLIKGLSIENYLKGKSIEIYKKYNPTIYYYEFGEIKKKVWKINKGNGHQLTTIYKTCVNELKENEKEFLERLETFIDYAGKYHLPINPENYKPENLKILSQDKITEIQINKRIELILEKL
ncbi:MAG TPA: hypothetical protein DEA97_03885 [Bacteroidales bacterium]|nr:MAG: hypothetical protein UR43_C0016G0006 [candidate division TM6 bacterium GW2011_GWF2_33_332]HBS85670.1 hypothetical protein [Bacteroidales bacterium]